jgi:aminoacrylate hydrolase
MPNLTLPDGESLYFEDHGSGPPLLLVSGLGGVMGFWSGHVPVLAERFRVILHDHRGTGKSGRSRIEYSVEQMAGDVLALMDHLGIERAHYCGHSTGGAMGQILAIEHPDRIGRLVLSATWPGPDPYFDALFANRAAVLSAMGIEAYARLSALFMKPPTWFRDHPGGAEADAMALLAADPDPEITLSRIAAIRRFDRRADLHRIAAPTLVFGAADDTVTPAYNFHALAAAIPEARLVMLPRGGHFYPNMAPEAFRSTVLGFLAEGI